MFDGTNQNKLWIKIGLWVYTNLFTHIILMSKIAKQTIQFTTLLPIACFFPEINAPTCSSERKGKEPSSIYALGLSFFHNIHFILYRASISNLVFGLAVETVMVLLSEAPGKASHSVSKVGVLFSVCLRNLFSTCDPQSRKHKSGKMLHSGEKHNY